MYVPVLLSAAIVGKLELVSVMFTKCCRCSCFVLLKMGDSDA
jgi:hypothetical protein